MDYKKVNLPSGAELHITVSPFKVAKELYQAILEELSHLRVDFGSEADLNFLKDLICKGFSSKKIEVALDKCFEKCTYKGLKISLDTWEPVEARGDYLQACVEVIKENISPFVKSLFAVYSTFSQGVQNDPALRQKTTPA